MGAIGKVKFVNFAGMLPIVGGIFLPKPLLFLVYWSPFYWLFKGLSGIISGDFLWKSLSLWQNAMIQGGLALVTAVIAWFIVLKSIKNGLSQFNG